jgi:hypothetical protein
VPNTYTVSNVSDGVVANPGDLPGSLRQAVYDANHHAGADSIVFNSSLSIIYLTAGELYVTDSVTITGQGPGNTVDGSGTYRVFEIHRSGGSAISVTITNLTIENGFFDGSGGGIFDNSENLTLSNCTLGFNSATSNGGAIYVTDAPSLTMSSCTITNNSASNGYGAGLYMDDPDDADGSASISLCTFGTSGNGNSASVGGAIYLYNLDATITIDTSTIAYNTATSTGAGGGAGGIGIDMATQVTVKNDTIANNSAARDGGGVYYPHSIVNTTTYNIQNSTIYGNTADYGGGVFVDGDSSGTTDFRVYNSTIAYNTANHSGSYVGGGIGFAAVTNTSAIYLDSTIVALNATPNGGTNKGADIGGNLSQSVEEHYGLIKDDSEGGWTLASASANNTYNGYDPGFATGTLTNNGGPTDTLALASTSHAVDNGDNPLSLDTDQRIGYADNARVSGTAADIGAYEYYQAPPP